MNENFIVDFSESEEHVPFPSGSGAGNGNYNNLKNKPKINGHTLEGNMSADDLGLSVDNGLPNGGTTGQYLIKQSSTDGDAVWSDLTEGFETTRSGLYSHAEGDRSIASGKHSHAEGRLTIASGDESHAEGGRTTASRSSAHAEGTGTTASNYAAHAEGAETTASGNASHAEGSLTTASGNLSHAEGYGTIANHKAQHAFGAWNVADPSEALSQNNGTYIEIVGNGTAENARSNARTLDWNGNETLAGDLTINKGKANETTISGALQDIQDMQVSLHGNLLPEFADFPTRTGTNFSLTFVWSADKRSAHVTGTTSNYKELVGLYDPLSLEWPDALEPGVTYMIYFSAPDSIQLRIDTNGTVARYSGNTTFCKQEGDTFQIYLELAQNTTFDDTFYIAMIDPNSSGGSVDVDDLVIVSDTQPTSSQNKIWALDTTPEGVLVPTYEEFEELADTVSLVNNELSKKADNLESAVNLEQYSPISYTIAETGKGIHYNTGAVVTAASYSATDYLDIDKYAYVKYSRTKSTSSGTVGMAFYDDTKTYIVGYRCVTSAEELGYDGLYVVGVPSNAKYARFSIYTDSSTYGDFELYAMSNLWKNEQIQNAVPLTEADANIYHIHSSNGNVTDTTGISITVGPYKVSDISAVSINDGYKAAVYLYDSEMTYQGIMSVRFDLAKISSISASYWFYSFIDLSSINQNYIVMFVVRKYDESSIDASELSNVSLVYNTDQTFQERIDSIRNAIGRIDYLPSDGWASGLIRSDTGGIAISSSIIYNSNFVKLDDTLSISVPAGYACVISAYSTANVSNFIGYYANGLYVKTNLRLKAGSYLTGEIYGSDFNPNYYYRFCLAKLDDGSIATTDGQKLVLRKVNPNAYDIVPLVKQDVTVLVNKLYGFNKAKVTNTKYTTVEFYPVDNVYKYYVNQRCFISQYSTNDYNSLIDVDCYQAESIIRLNPNTNYVVVSVYKDAVDSFYFYKLETNRDKLIEELVNGIDKTAMTCGITNSLASAKQYTFVEYTPIRRFPILGGGGKTFIQPGTVLRGIPYSSTSVVSKYVGQNLSFYTFLSAVKNPRSVLYTRRIKFRPAGCTYYGGTCFTLTSYAFGSRLGYFDNTYSHIDIDKDYYAVSPYDMQAGDLLYSPSHVAMIIRVFRDDCGRILNYTAMESHAPFPHQNTYAFEVLSNNYVKFSSYTNVRIMRPNRRVDRRTGNIDYGVYEQSPYIKGYDDEAIEELVPPDIMSEFGDRACTEAGTDVVINVINPEGYSSIEIYKNDVLIETKNVVEDFTMTNIAYGTYKFKLVGTSKSSETFLIAADVNGSYDPNTKIVTFSSANATPVYAAGYADSTTFERKHGVMHYVKRFTVAESNAGSADVSDIVSEKFPYVVVAFLTEYGTGVWLSRPFEDAWEYVDDNTPDVTIDGDDDEDGD